MPDLDILGDAGDPGGCLEGLFRPRTWLWLLAFACVLLGMVIVDNNIWVAVLLWAFAILLGFMAYWFNHD